MKKTARVLFVCLGNICRSPMAEAVMRHKAAAAGLQEIIDVDSAGTGDWHLGKAPHEGTQKVLDVHGVSYSGMAARQVDKKDFGRFHYIVAMDGKNLSDVSKLFGIGVTNEAGRKDEGAAVFSFMSLLPDRGVEDVPDPYYTGNFDYVYELVEEGCEVLLERIKQDMGKL